MLLPPCTPPSSDVTTITTPSPIPLPKIITKKKKKLEKKGETLHLISFSQNEKKLKCNQIVAPISSFLFYFVTLFLGYDFLSL
jgi:hypothetical protein